MQGRGRGVPEAQAQEEEARVAHEQPEPSRQPLIQDGAAGICTPSCLRERQVTVYRSVPGNWGSMAGECGRAASHRPSLPSVF
jgi:hypothetical protein